MYFKLNGYEFVLRVIVSVRVASCWKLRSQGTGIGLATQEGLMEAGRIWPRMISVMCGVCQRRAQVKQESISQEKTHLQEKQEKPTNHKDEEGAKKWYAITHGPIPVGVYHTEWKKLLPQFPDRQFFGSGVGLKVAKSEEEAKKHFIDKLGYNPNVWRSGEGWEDQNRARWAAVRVSRNAAVNQEEIIVEDCNVEGSGDECSQ